jgi:small subunit ribosomal protein S5
VLEAAGVKDILTKSLGSSNKLNMARATVLALSQLRNPKEVSAKRKLELKAEKKPTEKEETVTGG